MNRKKTIAAFLAGMLCVTSLSGCGNTPAAEPSKTDSAAQSAGETQQITDSGVLNIGYTLYEPMNYEGEDGKLTGFDTEFAEAVCEKLGVEPNFIEIDWNNKVLDLESKNIDCIWNGMTITEELQQSISISDAYVKNMQVVVISESNRDKFTDTASLADAKLAAEAGSAGELAIQSDENLSKANYTSVLKQVDALLEVKSGASDATVLDWTLAKHMIGEGTSYSDLMMIEGLELSAEEYGIGLRKNSDLRDTINDIIVEMKADGSLAMLADKYDLSIAE